MRIAIIVDQYIDEIVVTPEEQGARLGIRIFTGDVSEKAFRQVRVRSGNMAFTIFDVGQLTMAGETAC